MIDHNPTEIGQTHNGREATYYGGTAMATWYWRRLPSDPPGVDGYRLDTDGALLAVKLRANGYAAELRADG